MKLYHHSAEQCGSTLPEVVASIPTQLLSAPLQSNHHRHYDPTPGQWITEEPIGFQGDEQEGLHPYVGE